MLMVRWYPPMFRIGGKSISITESWMPPQEKNISLFHSSTKGLNNWPENIITAIWTSTLVFIRSSSLLKTKKKWLSLTRLERLLTGRCPLVFAMLQEYSNNVWSVFSQIMLKISLRCLWMTLQCMMHPLTNTWITLLRFLIGAYNPILCWTMKNTTSW